MREFQLTVFDYSESRDIEVIRDPDDPSVKDSRPYPGSDRRYLKVRLPTGESIRVQVSVDDFEKHIVPKITEDIVTDLIAVCPKLGEIPRGRLIKALENASGILCLVPCGHTGKSFGETEKTSSNSFFSDISLEKVAESILKGFESAPLEANQPNL